MGALSPFVVDVYLSSLSQTPADHQGPVGRLKSLIDCVSTHYTPTNGGLQLKVEPRDPFVSLTSSARSVADGTTVSALWANPEICNSLGNQLVSICNAIPRVYSAAAWSVYTAARVLPHPLSQDIFHTSNTVAQVTDNAVIGTVTCAVWTESTPTASGPKTAAWIGFKDSNGAWLVTPRVIGSSGTFARSILAKVVSDGSRFWIFFNDANSTNGLIIYVYDVNGAFLAGTATTLPHGGYPGYWDITAATSSGGYAVQLAIPVAVGNGVDSGVTFISYGWNGSAIIHSSATVDATIHCSGPVAWIINKVGNGLAYLGTCQGDTDDFSFIWAYEITERAQTHQYGGVSMPDLFALDSITGYTFSDAGVGVVLSYGLLAGIASGVPAGPRYDPQLRQLLSVQVTRGGTITTLRTTQSLCQVSRAFEIDDDYYVYAYYQSGSGLSITSNSLNVTHTAGDYMIGAAIQPLSVLPGDFTEGSSVSGSQTSFGGNVIKTPSSAPAGVASGDNVAFTTASGDSSPFGYNLPDGTPLLKWSVQSLPSSNLTGSRFNTSGNTIGDLNGTFDIVRDGGVVGGKHVFYTPVYMTDNTQVITVGNLSDGVASQSVTSLTMYGMPDALAAQIPDGVGQFFFNGSLVVTGGSTSGTNGTFTIARIRVNQKVYTSSSPSTVPFNFQPSAVPASAIWVVTVSQTSNADAFSYVVSPSSPNIWSFAAGEFDDTYIGTDLVVSNNLQVPTNVGTFAITSVPNKQTLTTGLATAVIAQIFSYPYPTVEIDLTTQIAYTFYLQSLTLDYTYQGALVSVQGADPQNNGTYKIIQINADGTFIATPTNGLSNQVNQSFTGVETITIFFNQDIAPEFQPTWFLVPLTGSQPVAGRFESGLAYADWRLEADISLGPNQYPMALSSPAISSAGTQITLPYRAQSVTTGVPLVTTVGQIAATQEILASTVGLKTFTINNAVGRSYDNGGELLIPGPMATTFTPSGFREDNINLAPEAPFLVSQSVASDPTQLTLTPGSKAQYFAVWEQTDENGNRIFSIPSPVLEVDMAGGNNVSTLGGRLLFPLDTSGAPVANTYGPTTRNATLSIYRSAWINGEPTTEHYKITDDLNVNGLAPISSTNPSGFSFPTPFTWQYIDQNPDIEITGNEVLYTDQGFLPRYPAPAFTNGVGSWCNREWVIGYDGAIWMSGEFTEGDAPWFFLGWRYVLPTTDKPKALAAMEDYLLIFCANSIWYIPKVNFPNDAKGILPTPVQLPFPVGSKNGFAVTIGLSTGVAYDSTAGGVWIITRSLENDWLSEPVQDSLTNDVTGLAIDKDQRLVIQQANSPTLCIWSTILKTWFLWNEPTQGLLLTTYQGQAAYQDTGTVNVITPGQVADLIAGTTYGIAPDITFASIAFSTQRSTKMVWELQAIGEYLGPHRLNIVLSYPDTTEPDTVFKPFIPDPTKPYVVPFNPMVEEATNYGLRIYADFVGVGSPGRSFTLELIGAEVGVERSGINKLPDSYRAVASK